MLALTLMVLCQIGSPQGVHLLDDSPLLAQAIPPLVPLPGVQSDAEVSAQQLQVDLDGLKKMRVGLGAGIALLAVGASGAVVGALNLALGTLISTSRCPSADRKDSSKPVLR